MVRNKGKFVSILNLIIFFILSLFLLNISHAASSEVIDINVNEALEKFYDKVKDGKTFLKRSKGVLVIPEVIKAGFLIGGKYGKGALRIGKNAKVGGKSVGYYSIGGGSFGLQLGFQSYALILVFMQNKALKEFREIAGDPKKGWEIGGEASVALAHLGAGGSVDTTTTNKPIVAFILTNVGLMYELALKGSKFTELDLKKKPKKKKKRKKRKK